MTLDGPLLRVLKRPRRKINTRSGDGVGAEKLGSFLDSWSVTGEVNFYSVLHAIFTYANACRALKTLRYGQSDGHDLLAFNRKDLKIFSIILRWRSDTRSVEGIGLP